MAHVISWAPSRRKFFHVKYSNAHNIVKYDPIWVQFDGRIHAHNDWYPRTAFYAMRHNCHNAPFTPQVSKWPYLCHIWSDYATIWLKDACLNDKYPCTTFAAMRYICQRAPFSSQIAQILKNPNLRICSAPQKRCPRPLVTEGWDFSIAKSLFVRIVIFIENLNLSYLSRGEFCVSAGNWVILIPAKTAHWNLMPFSAFGPGQGIYLLAPVA